MKRKKENDSCAGLVGEIPVREIGGGALVRQREAMTTGLELELELGAILFVVLSGEQLHSRVGTGEDLFR